MKTIIIAIITIALLLLGALVANAQNTTYLNDNCSTTGHWREADDASGSATVTSNGSTITLDGENNNGSDYQVAIEYREDIANPTPGVSDVFPTNADDGIVSFDIVSQPSAGRVTVSLFLYWVDDSCDIFDMPVGVSQWSVDTSADFSANAGTGTTFTVDLSSTHIQQQIDAAYAYAQIIYGGGVEEPEAFLIKISWESTTGSGSSLEIDNIQYNAPSALAITPSSCSTADELNGSGALPVTLSYFRASLNEEKQVLLQWQTEMEIDNSHFEVQHSSDGYSYSKLIEVEGMGTTTGTTVYSFTHIEATQGVNYYRLKQVDFDGDFEFSPLVHIKKKNAGSTILFTLDATSVVRKILLPEFTNEQPVTLLITEISGNIIKNITFEGDRYYRIPPQIQHGVYIITFMQGAEKVSQKIVL